MAYGGKTGGPEPEQMRRVWLMLFEKVSWERMSSFFMEVGWVNLSALNLYFVYLISRASVSKMFE